MLSNTQSASMSSMPYIVSIEGNIGAGKTTIIEELKNRYADSKTIMFLCEPVDVWESVLDNEGNNILMKFYGNPQKYAFPLQIMALTTRISLLEKAIQKAKEEGYKIIICERTIDADYNIFAKMLHSDKTMEDIEYQIYKKVYNEFVEKQNYKLNGIIYIDADTDICMGRIEKRKRKGETMAMTYLDKCKQYHEKWLLNAEHPPLNLLHIKTNEDTEYDINNNEDIGNQWIKRIEKYLSRFYDSNSKA
jgi:deoxyadenosine/deoxycytidine kinase